MVDVLSPDELITTRLESAARDQRAVRSMSGVGARKGLLFLPFQAEQPPGRFDVLGLAEHITDKGKTPNHSETQPPVFLEPWAHQGPEVKWWRWLLL